MLQLLVIIVWSSTDDSFLHQGKKLPANIDENAEEGDVSDEDSADEMEDDCKLMNGDVCSLFGPSPCLLLVSVRVTCSLCPADEVWIVRVFPVLYGSCLKWVVVMGCSPLLSCCDCTTIAAVCFCLFLCLWLFVLISCSSLFPICPFSSTVPCFFQSGRYCIKKKKSSSTTSEMSPSHSIISHPGCETLKWLDQKYWTLCVQDFAICKDSLSRPKHTQGHK